jgi:hypothetical protein
MSVQIHNGQEVYFTVKKKDSFEPFSCDKKFGFKCLAAGYLFYCHMLPQATFYLLTLIFLSFSLIWILPPVAILIQATPFVRGEENGVFEMFEKKIERADPSNSGHYEPCELLSKFFSFF